MRLFSPLYKWRNWGPRQRINWSKISIAIQDKILKPNLTSVQFSCSVVSDSLWPHEPQHTRPPCPSPTPRVHPNPHPSSRWCHPTLSSSVIPFSSCPQSLPASVFSNESALCIRWPNDWSFSFSINPPTEYSRLFSFRIDWLDLLVYFSLSKLPCLTGSRFICIITTESNPLFVMAV